MHLLRHERQRARRCRRPGKISIDMVIKAGYKPGFAGALTVTSSILGPIIPPSIPFVLYGVVTNTSIGALFLGGVGPGFSWRW